MRNSEITEQELRRPSFEEIKPTSDISIKECDEYWDDKLKQDADNLSREDASDRALNKLIDNYSNDLNQKSEFKDTLPRPPFSIDDLKIRTPEQNAEMREEFVRLKVALIKQWEERYGFSWPKYKEDLVGPTGKVLHKAGDRYDMHHIQPLKLGGENAVENITPLSAAIHFDKQGIHAKDSPCSKLISQMEA